MMLTDRLRGLLSTPHPTVGVEIASDHVSAVTIAGPSDKPVLAGHASVPLPEGAVAPGLNATNVTDPKVVTEALQMVFGQLPRRPTRVALVVPDSVAKVSLVRFEQVPAKAADLEQLIQWQVRKTAPFKLEDAQVSYSRGATPDAGGQEFVVALMRRDIVEGYERVCADAGVHAGIVDLASFNLINATLSPGTGEGDCLLVHVASGYSTIAIIRGRHLIFFRNRAADDERSLADLAHQTAMYYEDRLGGVGFSRVLLARSAVDGAPATALRATLEDRLSATVEPIESLIKPGGPAEPALIAALAAPIGLLLRDRPENTAA
jgi:type IV pilus assembly protein PilM